MHQRQVLAAALGAFEGVDHHAAHAECGVQAHLGGDLVGRPGADGAAGTGIRAFGALAHHHEIDVRIPREGAAHTGIQPARSQVDVMIELKTQAQQQPPLQHPAGYRRVADRPQQDGVVLAQLAEHRFRQQLPAGVETPRAQVVVRLLDTGQHRVKDFERLGRHLRPDAVATDNRKFHDRSTTSSLLAPTAAPIADRTSFGTS
ncbi:hypothetical protein A5674_06545 [Mycobacterium malmoense]|nr:hypothetical protein A5674_06545 [Mycobacterium malmoense]OCB35782.1 hypothetical protein A5676_00025 [Mycobacterium malmoense]